MKVVRLVTLMILSLIYCSVANAALTSDYSDVLLERILTEGTRQREIFSDLMRNIPDDHMLKSDTELFSAVQNIADAEPTKVDVYCMLPECFDSVIGENSNLSSVSSKAFAMSLRVNALPSFQDAIWLDFAATYGYSELQDWKGVAFIAFQYEADDPILLVTICNDGNSNAIIKTAPLYCSEMNYLKFRLVDQIDVEYGIDNFKHNVITYY